MKKLINIFGSCLLLFILVGCNEVEPVIDDEAGKTDDETTAILAEYSSDQKKVIDNFGEPDEFTISFNIDDEPRFETWKYLEIGQIFVFKDGKYDDAYSVEFGLPEDQVYLKAKIGPEDVYDLKDIDDLEELLEVDGVEVDVDEKVWEDAKFYDFGEVVNAATVGGDLVFVRTQSFVAPYKWEDLTKKVDAEVSGVSEKSVGGTFEFDGDYGFTLDFPERWSDFDVIEDFDDTGIAYLSFLMPTSDTNYAADGYVNMFTISAYLDAGEDDVPPFETYIGTNNELMYTFSHMNGLPPADLEEHVKDFDQIRESIELYDL